ncbi:MAG: hypothetical protein ACHREM_01125 [Polyangiales bacterium]
MGRPTARRVNYERDIVAVRRLVLVVEASNQPEAWTERALAKLAEIRELFLEADDRMRSRSSETKLRMAESTATSPQR